MPIILDLLLSFVDITVVSLDIFDPYGYYSKPIREYQSWRKACHKGNTYRLIKEGYIRDSGKNFEITRKAQRALGRLIYQNLEINIPDQWDKKWRIIIFDIPEEKRSDRNRFRQKLKNLGFEMIQKSVFCYPHDCLQEVIFLTKHLGIERYVTYFEAGNIVTNKNIFKIFSEK